eukprot:35690-Chlamydomonas_euryale.AAC.1
MAAAAAASRTSALAAAAGMCASPTAGLSMSSSQHLLSDMSMDPAAAQALDLSKQHQNILSLVSDELAPEIGGLNEAASSDTSEAAEEPAAPSLHAQ